MTQYKVTVDEKGVQRWYKHGTDIIHNEHGPAVVWEDGSEYWMQDDDYHRLDGPAVVWPNGSRFWYLDGKLHRLDGPAVEWPSGLVDYYINDAKLTKEQFELFAPLLRSL
jgi:hypothetical protein